MSELEPVKKTDRLVGDRVELVLVEPDLIRAHLENNKIAHTLHTSVDTDLPSPVTNADINIWLDQEHEIETSGSISFDLPNDDDPHWHQYVIRELESRLALSYIDDEQSDHIIHIRHDVNALYVRISERHYARVSLESDIEGCMAYISIVRREILEEQLMRSIDYDDSAPEIHPYEKLRAFANVWIKTIDSIADRYAISEKVTRVHRLKLSVPTTAHDTIDEAPEDESDIYEEDEADYMTFNMVGGLVEPKEHLKDIIYTFNDPEGAKAYGVSGSHFILHGPPGTGKTTLIEAFAKGLKEIAVSTQIYRIKSTDIVNMYIGASATNAQAVFEKAKLMSEDGPVVMFFDEIDALIGTSNQTHRERVDVINVFNVAITEINEKYANRIIIAGATNVSTDKLAASIIRSGRLEPIYVAKPNQSERVDIWSSVLVHSMQSYNPIHVSSDMLFYDKNDEPRQQEFSPYSDDINPIELAGLTDNMTGADFEKILAKARLFHYRKYRKTGIKDVVSQADLLREIKKLNAN